MTRSQRRIRITPEIVAYVRKTEAYRAGRDPIRLMRGHAGRLERAVGGLTTAQLRRRPAPGKWSIADILGHLLDTEVVYGYRYRMALCESGSPIQGYDQAGWAKTFRGRRVSTAALLRRIRQLREVNLELVTGVPRSWWTRYGMHSERGKETVRRTLELIAGHDLNHLDQIMAIRKKYGWTVRAPRALRPRARRRAAA
ncbi:MAG TPA: DinB family protein [Candidatus Binatia bacterium]|nr:DinB family protein [Candidatus Binatia bacterium]